jgi:hypothetical protein
MTLFVRENSVDIDLDSAYVVVINHQVGNLISSKSAGIEVTADPDFVSVP